MADTHEEQLLTDLLAHIAGEDACLDAPHLEARVIDAVDSTSSRSIPASVSATRRYVVIASAAAVLAAVLVPSMLWFNADVPTRTTEVTLDGPRSAPRATVAKPTISAPRVTARKPTRVTNPTNLTNRTN